MENKYEYWLNEVKRYPCRICVIPKEYRTYELCLESVKNNCLAFLDIPFEHKTYEMCLEFVKNLTLLSTGIKHIPPNIKKELIKNEVIERRTDTRQWCFKER